MDRLKNAALAGLLLCSGSLRAEESAAFPIDWYGDLRLRGEQTRDIPARADDIERVRGSLRAGGRYLNDSGFEFGAAIKLAAGSDDNDDNRRNKDNEESDAAGLDEFYLRYALSESAGVQVGKSRMPLVLTPMTWDRDLRPIGLSLDVNHPVNGYDALLLNAGYFAGDHLYGDESRLAAIQFGYGWMEGAETGFQAYLGYLRYDDLAVAVREGLVRTNRRLGARYLSDYELLDAQLIGRMPLAGQSLVARIDVVRNLGADDQNEGIRSSLVWGDAWNPGQWELGLSYQRVQRDAVIAAFAEDDWWFTSFARGGMPWVAYGFAPGWNAQLAGFFERRDGIQQDTRRLLLDVQARW